MMNKILRSPITTALLFALAIGLIGFGGIKGVAAAPRIESAEYGAQVQLSSIGTSLTENGSPVEGTLLASLVPEGQKFQIGKEYDEALGVQNTGTIDEYVRVTVYKYWVDKDGKQLKNTALDPDFIELNFLTDGGWSIDEAASTPERTVLYYSAPIAPGESTSDLSDTLSISTKTLTAVKGNEYDYEGVQFQIEAVADAVQTHNGTEAMTGAWGRTN